MNRLSSLQSIFIIQEHQSLWYIMVPSQPTGIKIPQKSQSVEHFNHRPTNNQSNNYSLNLSKLSIPTKKKQSLPKHLPTWTWLKKKWALSHPSIHSSGRPFGRPSKSSKLRSWEMRCVHSQNNWSPRPDRPGSGAHGPMVCHQSWWFASWRMIAGCLYGNNMG